MKSAPELDPELRGLLEEIAADPRSRLRLAPRHALRSWYLAGESVRPGALDATAAERHLVAAHREALAALYCEASTAVYWRAPEGCSRRPDFVLAGNADAHLEDALARLGSRDRAKGIPMPGMASGKQLAEAALALVPSSRARLCLAFHLRRDHPEVAMELFRDVGRWSADPDLRSRAWSGAGACAVTQHEPATALACYAAAARSNEGAAVWALNLAMCLADGDAVRRHLHQLESWSPSDPALSESIRVLRAWLSESTPDVDRAREVARKVQAVGSVTGRILNEYA